MTKNLGLINRLRDAESRLFPIYQAFIAIKEAREALEREK